MKIGKKGFLVVNDPDYYSYNEYNYDDQQPEYNYDENEENSEDGWGIVPKLSKKGRLPL